MCTIIAINVWIASVVVIWCITNTIYQRAVDTTLLLGGIIDRLNKLENK